MKTMPEISLTTDLNTAIRTIMKEADNELSERDILRILFVEFFTVSKAKNLSLSLMTDPIIVVIRTEYPHLNEDLDKLLLLT